MSDVLLAIGRSRLPFDSTFGSQGMERIQTPPSVNFSQALFSLRSKNIVKTCRGQDSGGGSSYPQKKFWTIWLWNLRWNIAWAKDVVRDRFCKFREGRSDVHWKAFDTLVVQILGPEHKPTKNDGFPRFSLKFGARLWIAVYNLARFSISSNIFKYHKYLQVS